jgi:hypothetical protein
MTSCRNDTPQPVQDDLDGLAGARLDAAQHLLGKNGEFFPFGVTLSAEGDEQMVAADPSLGEHPESQAVLEVFYAGVLADRDTLRGAAFVSDVRVDGSDAISVRFEHRDGGPAMEIMQRYAKKRFRGGIEYGATSVHSTDRRIWAAG